MYGKISSALALLLAGSAFLTQSVVESKLVFAHYMVRPLIDRRGLAREPSNT